MIVFALFGINAGLIGNFIHWEFVSSMFVTVLVCLFILFFPMKWYVDNPINSLPDAHRWWYLTYGPLTIYLSLDVIVFTSSLILLNRKRLTQ
jgi:hypothetical protein